MYQPESPEEPDNLLLFTPVVTAYRGANGWSAAVQRAFVAALARTGVLAAAARSVGRNPRSAYRLRVRTGEDSGFARAWDEVQRRGSEEALDASMAGDMPARRTEVFYRGRHVGKRTTYNSCLAYAAPRALDRRNAYWEAEKLDARMLLVGATELPNGREMCEASPHPGRRRTVVARPGAKHRSV